MNEMNRTEPYILNTAGTNVAIKKKEVRVDNLPIMVKATFSGEIRRPMSEISELMNAQIINVVHKNKTYPCYYDEVHVISYKNGRAFVTLTEI